MVKTLGLIGCGKMGRALLSGTEGLFTEGHVLVSDIIAENREAALLYQGVSIRENNASLVAACNAVILAVKPQAMQNVLNEISPFSEGKIIISIAAGITIDFLESHLSPGARVIRAMPNTPAMVGEGMTALAKGSLVGEEELNFAKTIFAAVGKTVIIEEKLMDAVTGLSGSGPAYIFVMIEALADGGVLMGIPRETALHMASQTVLGAAKLLIETGRHPGELKDMVTSPGGTTARGLLELEKGNLRSSVIAAVQAATLRSAELGK
ncbi:MAG: pyrroline-5-carboxylate reductase [Deltaproteobacteria bacterium]|nr:pyrroline-5-carboxylate reductase [Deltaproteobacteria bacterium]